MLLSYYPPSKCIPVFRALHRRFLITFRHYDFFGVFTPHGCTSITFRKLPTLRRMNRRNVDKKYRSGMFNKLHIRLSLTFAKVTAV